MILSRWVVVLALVLPVGCAGPTTVRSEDGSALRTLKRGCAAGDSAKCNSLGFAYQHGNAVQQNLTWARELFERACEDKDLGSCSNLAFLYDNALGVPHDRARAVALYTPACNGGNGIACANLGELYFAGRESTPDLGKAEFYERACDATRRRA